MQTAMRERANRWLAVVVAFALVMVLQAHGSDLNPGSQAPEFSLTDSHGEVHRLSDYAGTRVILEWTNHDCPFVRKHYDAGNMQQMQREARDADMVWLTVISSRPGAQGFVEPDEANALTAERDAYPTAVVFDPSGEVGRAYGARTTPEVVVIDEDGTIAYLGAVDDRPSARPASLEGARNHVRHALEDLLADRQVAVAQTTPYGCTIKY